MATDGAFSAAAGSCCSCPRTDARVQRTAAPAEDETGWEYVSYLAQSLDPDGILPPLETEDMTSGDIVNFLISEGISVEQLIAYYDEEDD